MLNKIKERIRHWIARWIWVALRYELDDFVELITRQYETQNQRLVERERAFEERMKSMESRIKAREQAVARLEESIGVVASQTTVAISDVLTQIALMSHGYDPATVLEQAGEPDFVATVLKLMQRVDKLEQLVKEQANDTNVD